MTSDHLLGMDAPDEMRQTAVSWYVRLQNPQLAASDRIEFRRWLDSDSRHVEAFSDVERLWQTLDVPARRLGASGWYRPSRLAALWQHLRTPLLALALLVLIVTGISIWRESGLATPTHPHQQEEPSQADH